MTREECEAALSKLAVKMVNVYHQYNPEGQYLCMGYLDGGEGPQNWFHVDNDWSRADCQKPIEVYGTLEEVNYNDGCKKSGRRDRDTGVAAGN